MKKMKAGILKGLLLAGALVFAGCSDVLDDPAQAGSGGATGTVQVQIGSPADARTLAPLPAGIKKYVLGYQNVSPDGPYAYKDAATTQTLNLEPGTWYFSAIGYQDDAKKEAVAKGSTAVTVSAGEAVSVSILLSEAGDVNVSGSFEYDVDWSAIASPANGGMGPTEVTLTLSPVADVSEFGNVGSVVRDLRQGNRDTGTDEISTIANNHATGKIPLPSGVYDLDIAVRTGGASIVDEDTTIHRKEKVYIYSYLSTTAKYTFTALDVAKVFLRGPRPVLIMAGIRYNASSIAVYDAKDGNLLKYSTANNAIETGTSYVTSGDWALYLAGYQIDQDVTGSSSVWIKATWTLSGETQTAWAEINIDDKHIVDISAAQLTFTGRTINYIAGNIPGTNPLNINGWGLNKGIVDTGYVNVKVGAGQYAVSTVRSALGGQKVYVRVSNQKAALTSIELIEKGIPLSGGPSQEYGTYFTVGNTDGTGNGPQPEEVKFEKTGTSEWILEFNMPSGGRESVYTLDETDQSLTVRAHLIIEGDTIRSVDVPTYVEPGTYYIGSTSAPNTNTYPNSYTIVKNVDESVGAITRTFLTTWYDSTGTGWIVPGIKELADISYNLDSRGSLYGADVVTFTPGDYWAAERGRTGTLALGFSYPGLYRTFGSNAQALPDSLTNPSDILDTNGGGENFNLVYTQASNTATTPTSSYRLEDPIGSFTANVRLVRTLSWTR
jgi:hypothetical protein